MCLFFISAISVSSVAIFVFPYLLSAFRLPLFTFIRCKCDQPDKYRPEDKEVSDHLYVEYLKDRPVKEQKTENEYKYPYLGIFHL